MNIDIHWIPQILREGPGGSAQFKPSAQIYFNRARDSGCDFSSVESDNLLTTLSHRVESIKACKATQSRILSLDRLVAYMLDYLVGAHFREKKVEFFSQCLKACFSGLTPNQARLREKKMLKPRSGSTWIKELYMPEIKLTGYPLLVYSTFYARSWLSLSL